MVAKKLGVSRETVSKWLKGTCVPRPDKQVRLAELLGVPHEALFPMTLHASKSNVKSPRSGVYAIVLAGGVGSRVGVGMPKQFVEILGKPVLAYTLEAYQNHPEVDGIEVVCVESHLDFLRKMVDRFGLTKVKWICKGGFDFQHSVMNGVNHLKGKIADNDIVMVHYGAAPFTSAEIISDGIKVCRKHGMSVSVTPCFQLMGSNDDGVSSSQWVNRDKFVQLACPQSYRFKYICDLYKEATEKNLLDKVEPHTTSLMYLMKRKLYFSYGDQTNVKITTKEDLDLFEGFALLKQRRSMEGGK